jgi:hypothetical protein
MNADETKGRFEHLYEIMSQSQNVENMETFGLTARHIFGKLATANPTMAQEWIDMLERMAWNNYLTRPEAEVIANKLVNQDGSKGPHWSYDVFKGAVESLGGKMSEEPYYNCYALWVTANMLYSDHFDSASEYVPKEDMPKYFYQMSLEKLKDTDRPKFVREYFKLR